MKFFEALKNGVEGVLQGKVMSVRTIRKEGRVNVFATVGVPEMCLNFDIFVPERFVPDVLEGVQVELAPELKVGQFNRPEIKFELQRVF